MLTWTFASHKEHSPSWYTVAIIVVLMLVVYGIVEQLYLMSVVSFLFAGVYLLMENNTAPTTEVHILENGIQVGASFYEYGAYSKYTIMNISNVPSFIRLYPIRKLSPLIDIPLTSEIDISELRGYLASVMEEDYNNNASNADTLIHAMKL